MDQHRHALEADLNVMLGAPADRRWLMAGAASLPVLGCGGSSASSPADTASTLAAATTTTTSTGASTSASCAAIPEETGGPYPADGTNSVNGSIVDALIMSGIVRSDIRSSFNGATATAAGVPLTIRLQLVNTNASCASLAGYAVYLWHCDRDGLYSLYSSGVTAQNYLRGVQEADASGMVTFTTIFPACYAGRMPHVHLEIYPTLARSASAANRVKTTQFTFPLATLNAVYATTGYGQSVSNLKQVSYATDMVFSDGTALQMPTVTGDASTGYIVTLTVGVPA
jgi:protocatechuate 3,4-dioxygenase beta subunit